MLYFLCTDLLEPVEVQFQVALIVWLRVVDTNLLFHFAMFLVEQNFVELELAAEMLLPEE